MRCFALSACTDNTRASTTNPDTDMNASDVFMDTFVPDESDVGDGEDMTLEADMMVDALVNR